MNLACFASTLKLFDTSHEVACFNDSRIPPNKADPSMRFKLGDRTQTDFYHTGTFSFPGLPPGVTFTSASGAFLGGGKTDGGVPEPASWALMLAGFFSLGAMLRVRRAWVGPPIH